MLFDIFRLLAIFEAKYFLCCLYVYICICNKLKHTHVTDLKKVKENRK